MRCKAIILIVFVALASVAVQANPGLAVDGLFSVGWNAGSGVAYERRPGVNLGVISFDEAGGERIALLANAADEIVVIDRRSGALIKRFAVANGARDLVFDGGIFYVLADERIVAYDERGKQISETPVPEAGRGTERIARYGGETYLLLPSGNSLKVDPRPFGASEDEGWITATGAFVSTALTGGDSFAVRVAGGEFAGFRLPYARGGKLAGVFVIGATPDRIALETQTFISENPVEVERQLLIIKLGGKTPVGIAAELRLPDTAYVLSNRDLKLADDGTVLNMVTAPAGAYLFALREATEGQPTQYPDFLGRSHYHFNKDLIRVETPDNAVRGINDFAAITRDQIIANAVPYTSQTWTATSANRWFGIACGGKTIQTPAWVQVGENVSMPYCWGGWTTTSAIQGYLDLGRSAGDNDTETAFGAEPSCAVGLDCSGFVSRAWGLTTKQATSTLPGISTTKPLSQTQPGDIVNIVSNHTRLIETNFGNGNYRVIESSGRDWKTSYFTYTAAQLAAYDPRAYNNVIGGNPPAALTLTLTPECNGTAGRIRLNWTNSIGAASYDIHRNGSLYTSGIAGTQFINSANLVVGQTYEYFVRAQNANGSADSNSLAAVAPNCSPAPRPFDFDGDGKSDISVFRPSNGQWWLNRSADGVIAHTFGNSGDSLAPADFTGDGKTDVAVFRPSTGEWFVLRSENSTFYSFPFGVSGDVPAPSDYDGDRKADAAVYRPSNSVWYIQRSAGGTAIEQFGASGDVPVPADYDGDGRADIAIFRPGSGQWWLNRSTSGLIVHTFGNSADTPVPRDFTGDGKADVAILRPAGGQWFILRSENGSFYSFPFGANGDSPVPGDYDGDGKFDAAVFRPSNATWYLNRSTAGLLIQTFGLPTDVAVPSAYVW
ncbi:MAG: VCBS repeat-containing protein [Acidobacteria bacterium]|nr:VCBS repeat-containing protein [Acidobacteriota bacterium]